MIKKIAVRASVVFALIAMAAPTAYAGTQWTTPAGGTEATGFLTSERGGLVTGPGHVHLQVELFNGLTRGEGAVTGGQVTGVVPTNLPDCHAKSTIPAASLPWPIMLTTDALHADMGQVDIGSATTTVTFINHYTTTTTPGEVAGCFPFGVPAEVKVEGIVTGTVENQEDEIEVCINLNETTGERLIDDLHIESTGQAAPTFDLTGVVCINGTEA